MVSSYKVTGSSNVKSFKKGQSYARLKANHFDVKDREEKGISRGEEFENLNRHFQFDERINQEFLDDYFNDLIDEYNQGPSRIKNPSRKHKNIESYVEKKQSAKRVNADFHGVNFMMVNKIGDMQMREDITDLFKRHGVDELELLNAFNGGFYEFGVWFNEEFDDAGLAIIEMDTNLDEVGAVHCHSNLVNVNIAKNGLPDTNFSSALKNKYGDGSNQALMALFRGDIDRKLVELGSERLKSLAKEHGFEFEGLDFIRKEAEDVGLDHNRYIQEQEIKRLEASKSDLEAQIDKLGVEYLDEQEKLLKLKSEATEAKMERDKTLKEVAVLKQQTESRPITVPAYLESFKKKYRLHEKIIEALEGHYEDMENLRTSRMKSEARLISNEYSQSNQNTVKGRGLGE